jgi:hypothetical protein
VGVKDRERGVREDVKERGGKAACCLTTIMVMRARVGAHLVDGLVQQRQVQQTVGNVRPQIDPHEEGHRRAEDVAPLSCPHMRARTREQ